MNAKLATSFRPRVTLSADLELAYATVQLAAPPEAAPVRLPGFRRISSPRGPALLFLVLNVPSGFLPSHWHVRRSASFRRGGSRTGHGVLPSKSRQKVLVKQNLRTQFRATRTTKMKQENNSSEHNRRGIMKRSHCSHSKTRSKRKITTKDTAHIFL